MAKFLIVIDSIAVFAGGNARPDAVLPFSVTIDGKTTEEKDCDTTLLLSAHHEGKTVRTQITPKDSTLALEKLLEDGNDVLVLSVSSGISESCNTANYIAQGLRIKFPERKIVVVDTLACGAGEGLLFSLANKWQQEGLDIEETAQKLEETTKLLHHLFISDDLSALEQSGIIPQTSVVNIKLIFDIMSGGKVGVFAKTMGKKKAVGDIVKYVSTTLNKDLLSSVIITYGDEQDAHSIGESLQKLLPSTSICYAKENKFVSAYLGEKAIGVCFFGEARK